MDSCCFGSSFSTLNTLFSCSISPIIPFRTDSIC
uniref:Uncharacterized protein n=1 Tax=Lepeophtheirus salmonis TaxID=72036 RepID=A0A0K2SXA9_LEPSM